MQPYIQPIVALIAGILILVQPKLLNYIVAIYLIIVGVDSVASGRLVVSCCSVSCEHAVRPSATLKSIEACFPVLIRMSSKQKFSKRMRCVRA